MDDRNCVAGDRDRFPGETASQQPVPAFETGLFRIEVSATHENVSAYQQGAADVEIATGHQALVSIGGGRETVCDIHTRILAILPLDKGRGTDGNRSFDPLNVAELFAQFVRRPFILGIEKGDPVGVERPDAGIARIAGPAGGVQADRPDPVIRDQVRHGALLIDGGRVVDDDQLPIRI